MEKRISWMLSVMLLLAMAMSFASCSDEENTGGETYFLSRDGKVAINILKDQASVSFYAKDETALRTELGKYGLTLTGVEPYRFEEDECTAAGWELMEDLVYGVVNGGDYEKAESARQYIVGGFPCCRLVEDGCLLIPQIIMYVRLADGIGYEALENFAEQNGIVIVSEYSAGVYILGCTDKSKGNIVETSNKLLTSGLVVWSDIMGFSHGHLT